MKLAATVGGNLWYSLAEAEAEALLCTVCAYAACDVSYADSAAGTPDSMKSLQRLQACVL